MYVAMTFDLSLFVDANCLQYLRGGDDRSGGWVDVPLSRPLPQTMSKSRTATPKIGHMAKSRQALLSLRAA